MVNENLIEKLDNLLERATKDNTARAELTELIRKLVYSSNPDEEAQDWLVGLLAKSPYDKLRNMALNDPDHMQKRCAGFALLRQIEKMPKIHARIEALEEILDNPALDSGVRTEAGAALIEDLCQNTATMDKVRLLMKRNDIPQAVRETAAEELSDFCISTDRHIYLAREVALSGEYGEVCERAGIKLVDYFFAKGNKVEIEVIADHEKTPPKVAAYAAKTLGREPKPLPRPEMDTLMGMPKPDLKEWIARGDRDMERARAANGGKPKAVIRR
ncbi:MAG: hypothetical protein WC350_05325 [Candidatus Micrarchaeia archaeon]